MIVIDTSVWADHFRRAEPRVAVMIAEADVFQHPFVTWELAVGDLRPRQRALLLLRSLPAVAVDDEDIFLTFLEERKLVAMGLGFIDVHLLIAAERCGAALWTRDRRLREQATKLGLSCIDD
ncbi:MAG: type II toxin-antitoxin system VapC family toxin [Novosphingobium sp.]|nr:type II toxin-antitoxin system VapC family toxin [Novosphingobium sp.]